ncbi:hypothetical protein DQ392_11810 [Streptomyces reniochalinae]|uniref:Uncharacterized protein n=1 Tax=Streptomyces reniochalinae TaxID=2250578 RepID=A0A367EP88_9ACTN|nr:hypothetical protein DQ392_11810 [Streptomyces reniochalinae]
MLLCVLAALATGCGIRATSVPVDAGAAPSRVGCVLPDEHESPRAGDARSLVRVYLVCGTRVSPVEREVRMPQGRSSAQRLPVARKLLQELERQPRTLEGAAGFTTDVPDGLTVESGAEGDPDEALRLNRPPDELPSFALAQLVCTYADTAAADADDGVVLGGPAGSPSDDGDEDAAGETKAPLKRYECDAALRARPEAAETAGTQV